MLDSFATRDTLEAGGRSYRYFSLARLARHFPIDHLPFSLRVLLENLLRHEDGQTTTAREIEALARWSPDRASETEIAFRAGEGPDAGLHRRSRGGGSRRDARCHGSAWAAIRRADQPARSRSIWSSTIRCRWIVFGHREALRSQRRSRVRAQPRALCLPALGAARPSPTSAWCRRGPASATR